MYFVNPLMFEFEPTKIANVSENGNVANDLARFIAEYEKKCLIEVLGSCLTKDLIDSFELTSGASKYTLKTTATDAIKRLVNGFEYDAPENSNNDFSMYGCGCGCSSLNCIKRYWKGLIQFDVFLFGTVQKSIVTNYIYYYYLLINRSTTTATGQQVLSGENSTTVQNVSKRIDAWNEFVFDVIGQKNKTSLYQFLKDNKADYPTWDANCSINFKDKY